MSIKRLFAVLLIFFSAVVCADDAAIHAALEKAGMVKQIVAISSSEYSGWQQVWLRGGRIVYVADDGSYIFQGSLFENTEEGLVNLTAGRQNMARAAELEQLPPEAFITYRAENMKSYITVFTDVGCPYCQKFHQQIAELTAKGVGVRYLPYPRRGLQSEDYDALVAVWCADDQVEALGRAKKGRRLRTAPCDTHPVDRSYELGQLMGVLGTPTIFFADGSMNTGYMDAKSLFERLGIKE